MRILTLRLSDEDAAAIDAAVATGDYASGEEVMAAALHTLLEPGFGPRRAEVLAEIAAFESEQVAGEPLLTADEVRRDIGKALGA